MGDSLSARYEYSELYCDSVGANYSNSSSSRPEIWPKYFFTEKRFHPAGFKIISAEIPFSFDTIYEENNTLILNTGIDYSISIPPGTYTGPELAVVLENTLNGSPSATTFTVSWDSFSLRFTITGSTAFSLEFPPISTDLQLGFKQGVWVSTGNVLTSPYAAAPTGPSYLYLNSETIGPLINANIQDGEQRINQLCKIPINTQKNGYIFYKDPNPQNFFDFLPGSKFNSFDLFLTLGYDQAQKPLDLKGLGFSIKVGILNYRQGGIPITQRPSNSNFFTG